MNNRQLRNFFSVARGALGRIVEDQSGQVLPMVMVMMIGMLGMCGLTMDVGRVFINYRQLQSSTDAAALAGAYTMSGPTASTASTVATSYSGAASDANAFAGAPTVTTTVTLKCLSSLTAGCAAPTNANAIRITETQVVPMTFARLFGMNSMTISATATAAMGGGNLPPYNVAIILDGTLSQASTDDNCGSGVTEMTCELQGVQILLQSLQPCAPPPAAAGACTISNGVSTYANDSVALFTFPALTIGTYATDTNCTTPITSAAARTNGYSNSSTYGYYSMEPSTAWSGIPTAAPYSFPTAGAISYPYTALSSTYQITPFLSDYRTSVSTTTLNPNSLLTKALGGVSGCGAMLPANYDGDIGTYYAGVLYAAQAALTAQKAANGATNVIILLSDGDATAPQSFNDGNGTTVYAMPAPPATSNGTYPSYNKMCAQAVTAAHYAASSGTRVYSIAYGSETSGCSSDSSGITPCSTMQNIASSAQYFFSDYAQSGNGINTNCVGTGATMTNLQNIFKVITDGLAGPHLIPNSAT
jgi:Flp pilus assembly protein TadG